MSRHFDEYVKLCVKLGERVFAREHGADVLIGLRVVGELAEHGERGEAQTFLAALHGEQNQSASLYRRVWPILKSPYGPPTPYIRLGRSADNDIVVPDYSISQHHCAFKLDATRGMLLADLGSHNGTHINDTPLSVRDPQPIQDQDELVLGRYLFEFLKAQTFIDRVCAQASYNLAGA